MHLKIKGVPEMISCLVARHKLLCRCVILGTFSSRCQLTSHLVVQMWICALQIMLTQELCSDQLLQIELFSKFPSGVS